MDLLFYSESHEGEDIIYLYKLIGAISKKNKLIFNVIKSPESISLLSWIKSPVACKKDTVILAYLETPVDMFTMFEMSCLLINVPIMIVSDRTRLMDKIICDYFYINMSNRINIGRNLDSWLKLHGDFKNRKDILSARRNLHLVTLIDVQRDINELYKLKVITSKLTSKEKQVFLLLDSGLSVSQIANYLRVKEYYIHIYMHRIKSKLK